MSLYYIKVTREIQILDKPDTIWLIAEDYKVTSPDGKLEIFIDIKDKGDLNYLLKADRKELLDSSSFRVSIERWQYLSIKRLGFIIYFREQSFWILEFCLGKEKGG